MNWFVLGQNTFASACDQIVRRSPRTGSIVAKQLELNGRQYWILSEPHSAGWRAWVAEVRADGGSDEVGIDATAGTRGAADELAERKLKRLLRGKAEN